MANSLAYVFPVAGEIFPDNLSLVLKNPLSGNLDSQGKFSFRLEGATLYGPNGFTLTGANVLLDNDHAEMAGKWIGIPLILRLRIGGISFLEGLIFENFSLNESHHLAIPNPFGGKTDLGNLRIKCEVKTKIFISISKNGFSGMAEARFRFRGKHTIRFSLGNQSPQSRESLLWILQKGVIDWIAHHLLPDSLFPSGELFPLDSLLKMDGKVGGHINKTGQLKLSAANIGLTLFNGTLPLPHVSALVTNDEVRFSTNWLGLDLTLQLKVTDKIILAGKTSLEVNLDVTHTMKVLNSLAKMLHLGSFPVSTLIFANIYFETGGDFFEGHINLLFTFLGRHTLRIPLSTPPATFEDLIKIIRDFAEKWILDNLLPDKFFPWGGLFPSNDLLKITGDLGGNIDKSGQFYVSADNVSITAFQKFTLATATVRLSNSELYIYGSFSVQPQLALLALNGTVTFSMTSSGVVNFTGSLTGSSGTFGFLTSSANITVTGSNILKPEGSITVSGNYSMISTPLFELGGNATVTLHSTGILDLSGTANVGTKLVKLTGASVEAFNIGAATKVTVKGGFKIDTTYLKISGGSITASIDANRNFSLTGNCGGGTGIFKTAAGSIELSNHSLKIYTSWLGRSLTLSCNDTLSLTGRLTFDYSFSVTLPKQCASASVGGYSKSACAGPVSAGARFYAYIDVTVSQTGFSATVGGYFDYDGRQYLTAFTIPASTNSLFAVQSSITSAIQNAVSSLFSKHIGRLFSSAASSATALAQSAYNAAQEALSDATGGLL